MPTFKRDGVELHYELDGSGPPVVIIGGFAQHSNDPIDSGLRQVLAQRFTVLAVDNRGSGQTVVGKGATVTVEDMVDDIAALIDHHRLGSVHTLGVSMGGCISLLLALRHPDTLCSQVVAVSLAQSAGKRTSFMLETLRQMLDTNMPLDIINRAFALVVLGETAFEDADFMEAWVKAPHDPFTQTRTGFEQQIAAMTHFDIRARLPSITAPTLVFSSPDDILVPPRYQEEIVSLIPEAEIKRYPGGHLFMSLPANFMQFVADVTAFWDKHS